MTDFADCLSGVPRDFEEHIGRPLSQTPDPVGQSASWAENFKAPLRSVFDTLGIEVDEISQSSMYLRGRYRDQILRAMSERQLIYDILARYRTKSRLTENDELPGNDRSFYSPYKPYCRSCGREVTNVLGYDEPTTVIHYRCECGEEDSFPLKRVDHGKLVWKVDWPMRWAHEHVLFEAGGADHSTPGSSLTVGSEIIEAVYGGTAPVYTEYSFVGADTGGEDEQFHRSAFDAHRGARSA